VSSAAPLKDDLELLERSVVAAAELVMGYFQRDPKSWKKNDVSPVSEADLASDALLRQMLLSDRSNYGWLSEETEDNPERLSRESVWVVDPIDGTNAFLQGKSDFTVCAGLVRGGKTVAGVVVNPVNKQTFTALRGGGAWLNGARITGPRSAMLGGARFLCRKNVMKPDRWRGHVPDSKPGYIGSLAYQLCLVAMGNWDAAISVNPLHEWDIAAAGLILREAGGKVTDQQCAAMTFNTRDPVIDGMICASPALHAEIRRDLIPKVAE
jgi:myo-inositol-1(or 4)-monophosphatase